jgi:hypothetical protein
MFLIVLTEIRLQRSFDDWQRTAFQSVVGAPDSSFSQIFKGLTAVAEKSTNMFARHGRGQEPDREGTARYASFTLCSQDLGQWTSREHRFACDELLSFISPAIRSDKWTIFGKPSAGPKAGQCGRLKYSYVRAMIYEGSAKRRKASVAGIGTVL